MRSAASGTKRGNKLLWVIIQGIVFLYVSLISFDFVSDVFDALSSKTLKIFLMPAYCLFVNVLICVLVFNLSYLLERNR